MIDSKHKLGKIVRVQERKKRQSNFSVAEHRTNPRVQQGGQREHGVGTRWDCFLHGGQGNSVCRRKDGMETVIDSEFSQPGGDKSCFISFVVP